MQATLAASQAQLCKWGLDMAGNVWESPEQATWTDVVRRHAWLFREMEH